MTPWAIWITTKDEIFVCGSTPSQCRTHRERPLFSNLTSQLPHRLTRAEIDAIGDMGTSADYRHVPISILRVLAQRSARSARHRRRGTAWYARMAGGAPGYRYTPQSRR